MLKGFKTFLLRDNVIIAAVGLAVALALSTLIKAFTDSVIEPLVTRAQGKNPISLGVQLGQANNPSTFMNFGNLVSALIYFAIFMAVLYFAIVMPYKMINARRGKTVFGEPAPTKECPACLSDDLPTGATKCKYCGTELAAA